MTLVRLVDHRGNLMGHLDKLEAHAAPGRLHEAFSVFIRDGRGRILLQQRAAGKYHFAGLWANACCSHPVEGEPIAQQARLRLEEEMGLDVALVEVGTFIYRAVDPVSGRVEHEFDHVFLGRSDDDPVPDPAEVGAWEWVAPSDLATRVAGADPRLAPWLVKALAAFPLLGE
jgi:isopentenyl-diphosphate delta-isomerase